jgi:hypothetical protein
VARGGPPGLGAATVVARPRGLGRDPRDRDANARQLGTRAATGQPELPVLAVPTASGSLLADTIVSACTWPVLTGTESIVTPPAHFYGDRAAAIVVRQAEMADGVDLQKVRTRLQATVACQRGARGWHRDAASHVKSTGTSPLLPPVGFITPGMNSCSNSWASPRL